MMNISLAAKIPADFDKYLEKLQWETSCFQDTKQLNKNEFRRADVIGLAVDYLSRMMITGDKNKAFRISLKFKEIPYFVNHPDNAMNKAADSFFEKINGMSDLSIINACYLVCFDDLVRAANFDHDKFLYLQTLQHDEYKPTVDNIQIMVQRCIEYFKHSEIDIGFGVKYGSLHGDGDFVTDTELCDLKTSKHYPTFKDKKQVILYWFAGLHTEGLDFSKINTLSIFNPRLNMVWKLKTSQFTEELLEDADMFCQELS